MRITVIGLGAMGRPIASRLAGHRDIELTVFDVSQRAMAEFQAEADKPGSVGEAVRDADVIITIVPADEHVVALADEVATVAAPGTLFADFSTIGPSTIRAVADRLARAGIPTVSVGMTRSTAAAESGQLVLYVGGDARDAEVLHRVFDVVSEEATSTGPLESAKAMKLVNNLIIATIDVAICEAMVLGERYDLSRRAVVDGLVQHGATSWALSNHIERYVLTDDLGPGRFSTRYMAKDMLLCQTMATEYEHQAVFPGLLASLYRGTIAMGFGEHYHMVVIEWLRRAAAALPGSRAESGRGSASLEALAAGVAAIQALVTEEAVQLVRLAGVTDGDARDHLSAGSAGNSWLDRTIRESGSMAMAGSVARSALDGVLRLARAVDYPGIVFESARATTFQLQGRPT